MSYQHPKPGVKLSKQERTELLKDYYAFCAEQFSKDAKALNRKVPREAFRGFHDRVGLLLLEEAKQLAAHNGIMRNFLDANPLPERMKAYLPDDYRIFCLLLNSLRQWSMKELAQTDKYVIGS